MCSNLLSAVVLLMAGIDVINLSVMPQLSVEECFEGYDATPDVMSCAPKCEAIVNYPSGVRVNLGNELTPTPMKDKPTIYYNAAPKDFYALSLVDPVVPSRAESALREWKHWLAVNIPGNIIDSGESLAEFVGTALPFGTGSHRYVFLMYQKRGLLTFDKPRLNNTSVYNSTKFTIAKFAKKYKLGNPVAGNFYQAQYIMTMYPFSRNNWAFNY